MKFKTFNKAQLLTLNQLVQALPMSERKMYLDGLGELWEYLSNSADYLVDERDYNIYSIVRIGDQEWLGENLRYKGVPHYENSENPNIFYGCLYTWATVMGIDEQYDKKYWQKGDQKHRGIAPEGWHIPSDEDWQQLERVVGMSEAELEEESWRGDIGNQLKSVHGWKKDGGDNISGFEALPAGDCWGGSFYNLGEFATFCCSREYSSHYVWYRSLYFNSGYVNRSYDDKSDAYSCRCVRKKLI